MGVATIEVLLSEEVACLETAEWRRPMEAPPGAIPWKASAPCKSTRPAARYFVVPIVDVARAP